MRIKTLKKFDNWCGSALLIIFWPLARVLSKFSITTFLPAQKICVLKVLGGGSLLIAYPSLKAIKNSHPDKKFVLVCSKEVSNYAGLCDLFDEIYEIDVSNFRNLFVTGFKAFHGAFRSKIIINIEMHSKMYVFFSFLTFSYSRICLFQTWNRWQKSYINKLLFFNSNSPVYVGYEQIAESLGSKPLKQSQAITNFLNLFPLSSSIGKSNIGRILGVAPFCSDLCKERAFDLSELILVLAKEMESSDHIYSEIQIFGGTGDVSISPQIISAIQNTFPAVMVTDLVGKIPLTIVPIYLQKLDLLIAIDSGINHLARLLDTPSLTYWGPTDPYLYLKDINPIKERIKYQKIPCSPCVHITENAPCNGENVCMKQYVNPMMDTNRIWEIKD